VSQFVFKMPDLGEGTVEAEIIAWHTAPGATVAEDQIIVEVMTDKAAVEVPAPVGGKVVSITGAPGDKVAVGSPLIVFETGAPAAAASKPAGAGGAGGAGVAKAEVAKAEVAKAEVPRAEARKTEVPKTEVPKTEVPKTEVPKTEVPKTEARKTEAPTTEAPKAVAPAARSAPASAPAAATAATASAVAGRIMTSPANRRRAREAGIDLATVVGSGPGGRIIREDLASAASASGPGPAPAAASPRPGGDVSAETSEIKVIGLRRLIAERMSEAKRNIPHFAYVEEVDVTELEALRQHLNSKHSRGEPSFTYLPLVIAALVRTLESFPQCNVLYDAARGVLVRHRAVHVGVATQTPDGLKVPVVRHAERLALPALAAEIRRVTERARTNKASREELVGSTITVTSLGKLGGIASTPIINAPEVAIIGLNKAVERPVVHQGAVAIRRIMNLSSSFDHRFVDGYDAAAMIQALKELLEHPAMIFIPR
jgi:2-oxoisovalerate dehydrogenase E2 component (dihydrolipoyl transacylase)